MANEDQNFVREPELYEYMLRGWLRDALADLKQRRAYPEVSEGRQARASSGLGIGSDLTFAQVKAGAKALEACLADSDLRERGNFPAEAAVRIYHAMQCAAPGTNERPG